MSAIPEEPFYQRIAYRMSDDAAKACGMKRDYFNDHVKPHLHLIYLGSDKYVLHTELQRALEKLQQRPPVEG